MTGTSPGTGPVIGDRSGHRSSTTDQSPGTGQSHRSTGTSPIKGTGRPGPVRSHRSPWTGPVNWYQVPVTMDRSGHRSWQGSEEEVLHLHLTILLFGRKTHHHQRPATIDTIG
ncbi:hypothetical protein DPMN_180213 [Dreissena polymorpha]|uniref:Uncharacterized protein n=1 Tax=Dreissena polymorpha TaxID=45954 RepID=A0A9D4EIR8_DREPO|nr:hypothetical protein DPMN_180213 [Dreissena polymorpha]